MSGRRLPFVWALLCLALWLGPAWSTQAAAPQTVLTGVVWLEGRTDHRHIQILLDGIPYTLTNQTGQFALALADEERHEIRARYPGYLSRAYTVSLQQASVLSMLPTTRLPLGDADRDDDVDIADLLIVSAAFGTSPSSDARADLTGDGKVDEADLVGLVGNYGQRGPLPWLAADTPTTVTPTASPSPTLTPSAPPPTAPPTATEAPVARPTPLSTPRPLRTATPTPTASP